MKKNIYFIISFLLLMPIFIFAQIKNPLGDNVTISSIITEILGYVVKIGGIIATFFLIYSGYLFVKAQGKPEKLKEAREIFKNVCIGTAILLGAQLIASIIVGTIKSLQ
ncbi:MAG: hypothetical protein V1910_02530 [bacterium]